MILGGQNDFVTFCRKIRNENRNEYKVDKEVSVNAGIEFVNVYDRRWFNKD